MTRIVSGCGEQGPVGGTDGSGEGREFDVAIVGGGFSGICTAYHLLLHGGLPPGFSCCIVEPGERLGAGLAYGTDSPRHLLNVRARGMGISETDHGSFVRWLSHAAPEYGADDFVPRGLYRRYTASCLEQAEEQRPGALTVLRDEVLGVHPWSDSRRYALRLRSGASIRAGIVVLAIGNLPSRTSFDNDLLRSPWCGTADYRHLKTLAIIGTGLTSLDVILEAEASGFTGKYWIISPHGQFPLPHRESFSPVPAELRRWAEELAASGPRLRLALRAFQDKRRSGVDWQQLVDSLRRFVPGIWSGFDRRDKRLFLRHLRCLWNIHLHRSCRESVQVVARLRDCGRLEHVRARVTAVEKPDCPGHCAVRLRLGAGTLPSLDVDAAVNATGLFSNILKTGSALVGQLLDAGMAQPDEFRLGFRANGNGQLLAPDGSVRSDLFAVGTLRRGEELECTAVPEIRRQVATIVEEIVRQTGRK